MIDHDSALEAARQHASSGQFDEALEAANTGLVDHPTSAGLLAMKLDCLWSAGAKQDAARLAHAELTQQRDWKAHFASFLRPATAFENPDDVGPYLAALTEVFGARKPILAKEIDWALECQRPHHALDLIAHFETRFPEFPRTNQMKATAAQMLGRYREAERLLERVNKETPQNVKACLAYVKLLEDTDPSNSSRQIDALERTAAASPKNHVIPTTIGKIHLDKSSNTDAAKQAFLRALALKPDGLPILKGLLRVAIQEADSGAIERYSNELSAKNINVEPLFAPEKSRAAPQFKHTLSTLLAIDYSKKPKIIDIEGTDFAALASSENKIIALYAYAKPRPNLDILYDFYIKLRALGHNVAIFLNGEDVPDLNFSEIEFDETDVMYRIWPGFFYDQDNISCIITNDTCRIEATKLKPGCKLVIHAPHNTNSPITDPRNMKPHYATYLSEMGPAPDKAYEKLPISPDQVCLIPNSYSKNEYLSDFLTNFRSPAKVISYCPSTLREINRAIKTSDNPAFFLNSYVDEHIKLVRNVLAQYPEHHFVYRPFLPHWEHRIVTNPFLEEFAEEERFVFDDVSNSKYCLAICDAFISDTSGVGNTYFDTRQKPFVSFIPKFSNEDPIKEKRAKSIYCETAEAALATVDSIISGTTDGSLQPVDGAADQLRGISYLVENIDFILTDTENPDWFYVDMNNETNTGFLRGSARALRSRG